MRPLGLLTQSPRAYPIGAGGLFFCLAMAGCGPHAAPSARVPTTSAGSDTLAPGVVHHAIQTGNGTGVDLVEVDTRQAAVRLQITTEAIGREGGMIGGQAYTPHEWLLKTRALAAVNGGYFGREDGAGRKEFIGLLVQGGKVRHAAPPLVGHGGAYARAGRYVRAALGTTPQGLPTIAWAATQPGQPQVLLAYSSPDMRGPAAPWNVVNGVGCGPMLLSRGQVRVTDRQERLASAGALPRTFVAYDTGCAHYIIGMASGMEYAPLAEFIRGYFARQDHTRAEAAMCLDGGASTQLSYRTGHVGAYGPVQSPRETGVAVPDAIVILPRS